MTKELPKEVSSGIVKIGDLELEVVNLDNGQRLFTEESVEKLFSIKLARE
jgi:hypothetical protein